MGRPRKPLHLHLINGNPGKRNRAAEIATQALAEAHAIRTPMPSPPDILVGLALDEWNRVCKALHVLGILAATDAMSLAAMCKAYARWIAADEHFDAMMRAPRAEHGALMITNAAGSYMQNPLLIAARAERADYMKYAMEFGLTPSSRARIHAKVAETEKAKDPAKKYFNTVPG